MKSVLPALIVILGVVLLACSFLWAIIFPASHGWTDEKAARMTELSAKAHAIGFELVEAEKPSMHRGRSLAEVKAQSDQINEELKALRDELEGKLAAPTRMSSILRWTGIAIMGIGAIGMMATRQN